MDVGGTHQILDALAPDLGMLPINADEIGPGLRHHLDGDRVRDCAKRADKQARVEALCAKIVHLSVSGRVMLTAMEKV
jgi:hypothetical protein